MNKFLDISSMIFLFIILCYGDIIISYIWNVKIKKKSFKEWNEGEKI